MSRLFLAERLTGMMHSVCNDSTPLVCFRPHFALTPREPYREESSAEYDRQRCECEVKHLARRAQKLGFTLAAVPTESVGSPVLKSGVGAVSEQRTVGRLVRKAVFTGNTLCFALLFVGALAAY